MQKEENRQGIRLNKYLAQGGICSRREADKLIESGKVYVNGKVAVMGTLVQPDDQVSVGKKTVEKDKETVVLAYYKPIGVTCTERDRFAKKNVIDEIGYHKRVTYAGRLDKDSEGLLLLTNDGDLIQAMMKGANGHEKEYQVKVNRELDQKDLEALEKGIYLPALSKTTKPCKIYKKGKYTMNIVLTEGLNRQIRRMCGAYSYRVDQLKRIRVMNVELQNMKPGQVRELTSEEITELYRRCGLRPEKGYK